MNIPFLNVVFVVTLYMALHFICSFWIGFCFLLLSLPISFFSIINVISLGAITNKNSNSEQNQVQKACIIDLSKYAYTFPPLLQHWTSLCVYMFFFNKVLFFTFELVNLILLDLWSIWSLKGIFFDHFLIATILNLN